MSFEVIFIFKIHLSTFFFQKYFDFNPVKNISLIET